METCACCQQSAKKLVLHHWFQPPDYRVRAAYVCERCNRFLIPAKLWPKDALITRNWDTAVCIELNHVLPMFFFQQLIILHGCYSDQYDGSIRRTYKFPLVPVPFPAQDAIWRRSRCCVVPMRDSDAITQLIIPIREMRKLRLTLSKGS